MILVITRHAPLVAYLRERGIIPGAEDGAGMCRCCGAPVRPEAAGYHGAPCACPAARVIDHATPEDVRGQHVVGVLPLSLAALAASVTEIPLALTPADRQAMTAGDLPIERLREIAGAPVTYRVTVIPPRAVGGQRES